MFLLTWHSVWRGVQGPASRGGGGRVCTRSLEFSTGEGVEVNLLRFPTNELFPEGKGHEEVPAFGFPSARGPGFGAQLLTRICVPSSLLPSITLNVLFVYVVLALYLMCSHIFYSSLAFYEGKLPANLRGAICCHQSSVSVLGTSWDELDLKHKM